MKIYWNNIWNKYTLNKIDKYVFNEYNDQILGGSSIADNKSLIFSMNTKTGETLKVGYIKSELSDCAFKLYHFDHEKLFTIGKSDICVYKQENKNQMTLTKQSFDWDFKNSKISVKRIVVLQMTP